MLNQTLFTHYYNPNFCLSAYDFVPFTPIIHLIRINDSGTIPKMVNVPNMIINFYSK